MTDVIFAQKNTNSDASRAPHASLLPLQRARQQSCPTLRNSFHSRSSARYLHFPGARPCIFQYFTLNFLRPVSSNAILYIIANRTHLLPLFSQDLEISHTPRDAEIGWRRLSLPSSCRWLQEVLSEQGLFLELHLSSQEQNRGGTLDSLFGPVVSKQIAIFLVRNNHDSLTIYFKGIRILHAQVLSGKEAKASCPGKTSYCTAPCHAK